MTADKIEPAVHVLQQSWLDTYVNPDYGVTREWIEKRHQSQRTAEKIEARRKRFEDTNTAGWVAEDLAGNIIGMATPYRDNEGVQHVGALYVDKKWHGKGVGSALMQRVIEWFDSSKPIVLGVVTYNERARAFYRKWGFIEVPSSETLFADKMPEVKMVREPIRHAAQQ
ncbi:GNAT family N-acetyltransferase [Streptomyces phaeochromogenes]|uniref:GNAT family N-acetyltransferase n=1 Tax=Streptomyces phaeochromogenes TaxID=1923 RepID=UPI00367A9D4B